MNYEAFKSAFMAALRQSRLPVVGTGGQEQIDPYSLDREFVVHVEPIGRGLSPPLHVSGSISFRWDALLRRRQVAGVKPTRIASEFRLLSCQAHVTAFQVAKDLARHVR